MDMNVGYWILEYGKVVAGYLFLMFLWPSVVFSMHLRGKSKTYRFGFSVTVPIVIMNTVVLLLGLLHMLNQWIVCVFFYGIFALALLKNIAAHLDRKYKSMMEAKFPDVRTLKGKYRSLVLILLFFVVCYRYVKGAAHFLSFDYIKKIKTSNWPKIKVKIKERIWNFGRMISTLFWKYGILAIVIVFGMTYFSYGAFQVCSYGYGDLYTHHKWVYELIQGQLFPDGVYPEAMHCFIYCMHTLLGIRVYSILLFLQGIHVAVFLLSVYCLLRNVFRWRYTPVFVLMFFLTLDLSNADLIHSMFRLQITLPQEFGLHTVCLCALYLVNYLNGEHRTDSLDKKGKRRRCFWDENLFLFLMSLSAAIMIHFHTMLMLIIVCVAFAVVLLKKVLNAKYLIPLVSAVACACLIAVTPMVCALVQGTPFNMSIGWAINAMNGDEDREFRNLDAQADDDQGSVEETDEAQNIKRSEISITGTIIRGINEIYRKGYAALYGKGRGGWAMAMTAFAIILCLAVRSNKRLSFLKGVHAGYSSVIIASVLYIFVYMAPLIGLPNVIPEGRFFAPGHMLLLSVMLMPVDIAFSWLQLFSSDLVLRILSLVSVAGIYGIIVATGNFRGLLFYELSRYNAAAMVTESIIDTFPRYSYTIVSPTDELYPVVQYGWHEELLGFVENYNNDGYSIPSEYIFIFVEKKPLLYAQSFFFQGPWWMGEEKYLEPFWQVYALKYPDSTASQSPEVITVRISEEEAAKNLPEYENPWDMYVKSEKRSLLEAKAYEWCQWFEQEHPSVLNVYYEDDAFVCYYFRQDLGSAPYELGMGNNAHSMEQ